MKYMDDFKEKQALVWEKTKKAIDSNFPVFGWELGFPEYYCINGYDEAGYFFWDYINNNTSHKPWDKLGETDIGCIENDIVMPGSLAKPEKTLKDAIAFTLKHASNPSDWIFDKYRSGVEAFDLWIKAFENGTAHGQGTAYNAQVWFECRELAAEFLKEAKSKINRSENLFDNCIQVYEQIAWNLKIVTEQFPFCDRKPEHIKDAERISKSVEALKKVRDFESPSPAAPSFPRRIVINLFLGGSYVEMDRISTFSLRQRFLGVNRG